MSIVFYFTGLLQKKNPLVTAQKSEMIIIGITENPGSPNAPVRSLSMPVLKLVKMLPVTFLLESGLLLHC